MASALNGRRSAKGARQVETHGRYEIITVPLSGKLQPYALAIWRGQDQQGRGRWSAWSCALEQHASGERTTAVVMLRWVRIAPFGLPVVPDVSVAELNCVSED